MHSTDRVLDQAAANIGTHIVEIVGPREGDDAFSVSLDQDCSRVRCSEDAHRRVSLGNAGAIGVAQKRQFGQIVIRHSCTQYEKTGAGAIRGSLSVGRLAGLISVYLIACRGQRASTRRCLHAIDVLLHRQVGLVRHANSKNQPVIAGHGLPVVIQELVSEVVRNPLGSRSVARKESDHLAGRFAAHTSHSDEK